MRKALVVGIDYYSHKSPLYGCVNDALAVKPVLERHDDGTRNFAVQLLLASAGRAVTREMLKESVRDLFAHDSEVALLYYAGHGYMESTGGYLCASDSRKGEAALALAEVLTLANQSRARNKVIILDSCHSGVAGTNPIAPQ
ncbi:MAG TPA: caspase family protein, partial [Longimicrobium sp.]